MFFGGCGVGADTNLANIGQKNTQRAQTAQQGTLRGEEGFGCSVDNGAFE
jgi:hypothetical protein